MNRAEIVSWAQAQYEDLTFSRARRWCEEGGKAIGVLPVWVPRETIHAAGMLPVGIHGADIEIIRGDAYYQSYICHLPRSILELLLSGRLDGLSGVLFPSTCDVIRNLSGMWKILRPDTYVKYVDLPQTGDHAVGALFWRHEIQTLLRDLSAVSGVEATPERLRDAIRVWNEARRTVRELYRRRREAPWDIPTEELFLLLRAAEVVPVEEFLEVARAYLAAVDREPGRPRDNVRVVVIGAFCEQPPLGLVKTLERSGCYVVDDDFLLGNRLIGEDVAEDGDPVDALVDAFFRSAAKTSVLYEPDPLGKRRLVKDRVEAAGAAGVVFAAPSFCDPALLDRPMLKEGADTAGIPCIAFQYAENTAQFQQFREQAGTFADSIKLWGGT